ncbi:MAG: glycerate kinase type-2 family protein [Thermoguttaceae bacterium]
MTRSSLQLREDILAIWKAGIAGVQVDSLMRKTICLIKNSALQTAIKIGEDIFPISEINRILVIGGGKASGSMAETLESILAPIFDQIELTGIVNVPDDCVKSLRKITLNGARPAGVNEPRDAGVRGTNAMLKLISTLKPNDLCICLLSGGGSALLPAPVTAISLADKIEVTRFLSGMGANIQEMNTIRKQLSRVKGGGIKRLCRNRKLVSLILSDVLGDPLDVIASGPTVDNSTTPEDALHILQHFIRRFEQNQANNVEMLDQMDSIHNISIHNVLRFLENRVQEQKSLTTSQKLTNPHHSESDTQTQHGLVRNLIIGNNAVAVEAANEEALRRGYSPAMHVSHKCEENAEKVASHLAEIGINMTKSGPDCLIHGGEPVVQLVCEQIRGTGGRNQQLVLAALSYLMENNLLDCPKKPFPFALLSGGTDGEDGPTDAAGAWIDPLFWNQWKEKNGLSSSCESEAVFNPNGFLKRNDAYHFFEPFGTLLKTGATGTNVCDIRILLVDREAK